MAKKKKKRFSPLPFLLIALVAIGAYFLLHNVVFVIRHVEVSGAGAFVPEEVIRLAQIPIGKPLDALDADKVQRAVESTGQLAFDGLSVQRPDTVLLNVHERTLAALVQNAGSLIGLDVDGHVIGQYSELPGTGAVFITGLNVQHFTLGQRLGVSSDTLDAMSAALSALKTVGAEALVSELNLADVRQLYFYSRTGIQVSLGGPDNMERKLQWMKSALLDLESRGETRGWLDVSSGDKADYKPPQGN